jgi:predicted nucleotidyltransferase
VSRPPELDPLPSGYAELYDRILAETRDLPGVQAVKLGGSLARGEADAYSDLDLDLVVVVDDAAMFDAPAVVRAAATGTVLLRELPFGVVAVTTELLRLDLVVTETDGDPPSSDPPDPAGIAEEFLRILGLLPVVVGREEWIVGSNAGWLLRTLLVQLLLAENGEHTPTGAKRLNEKLSAEQRRLVETLPPIAATRDGVIRSHVETARAFLPRARRLAGDWPQALEDATRAQLVRELDLELP